MPAGGLRASVTPLEDPSDIVIAWVPTVPLIQSLPVRAVAEALPVVTLTHTVAVWVTLAGIAVTSSNFGALAAPLVPAAPCPTPPVDVVGFTAAGFTPAGLTAPRSTDALALS